VGLSKNEMQAFEDEKFGLITCPADTTFPGNAL
jgi:hypothetical protein